MSNRRKILYYRVIRNSPVKGQHTLLGAHWANGLVSSTLKYVGSLDHIDRVLKDERRHGWDLVLNEQLEDEEPRIYVR
jgi:hypothetical protein